LNRKGEFITESEEKEKKYEEKGNSWKKRDMVLLKRRKNEK
jgi:hypothetical protein